MPDRTESTVLIDAAPAEVLDVIADFEAYPEWTGAVRRAEVLAEDEDGWAEEVAFDLDAGAIKDSYTLSYTWAVNEEGAGTIAWTLVKANVLKTMDGAYRLRGVEGGTDVTYELSVEVRMPMLGMLRRKAEKTIIDTALNELKKRVEG